MTVSASIAVNTTSLFVSRGSPGPRLAAWARHGTEVHLCRICVAIRCWVTKTVARGMGCWRRVEDGRGRPSCVSIRLVLSQPNRAQSRVTELANDADAVTPTAIDSTERDDIQASLGGDGDAFARIVQRHQQAVAERMWRFTRDRTTYEELVQEVFVEAYLSLHTYKAKSPLQHWLMRIATRVGYKYWKSRQGGPAAVSFSLQDWDQVAGGQGNDTTDDDAAEQVQALLARLAPRDRLVLTLMYLEGCTVEEIAAATGWTKSMVKVQAHRARKRLRKMLEESPEESLP